MKSRKHSNGQNVCRRQHPATLYTFSVALNVVGREFNHEFTPLEYKSYSIKKDKDTDQWTEEINVWGTDAFVEMACASAADRHRLTKAITNESLKNVACAESITSVELTIYRKGWPDQSETRVIKQTSCPHHGTFQGLRVLPHEKPEEGLSLCSAGFYSAREIEVIQHDLIKSIKVGGGSVVLESSDLTQQPEVMLATNTKESAYKLAAALRARTVHTIAINDYVKSIMVNSLNPALPMRYYTAEGFREPENHIFVEWGAKFSTSGYEEDGVPCYLMAHGEFKPPGQLAALYPSSQGTEEGVVE